MTGRWFDSSPRTQNLKRGEVEVIRRLLVVLSLSASLLVGTCFAWDSESFIGNDYSMYAIGDTPAIRRASRSVSAYAAESGFSATVLSGIDLFSRFSFAHDPLSLGSIMNLKLLPVFLSLLGRNSVVLRLMV